jgi:hypothetical protein
MSDCELPKEWLGSSNIWKDSKRYCSIVLSNEETRDRDYLIY